MIFKKAIKSKIKYFMGAYAYLILRCRCFKRENVCLLISHEMSMTGAPLALVNCATAFRELGYFPIIICLSEGPATTEFKKRKFPVFVLHTVTKGCEKWLKSKRFECILFNSLLSISWVELLEINNSKKIWWIHEGITYVEKLYRRYEIVKKDGIRILLVSEWTAQSFKKCGITVDPCFYMPYSLEDNSNEYKAGYEKSNVKQDKRKKYTVLIVGALTERKNQLEAIEALKLLPEMIRHKTQLRLVGGGNQNYIESIKREAGNELEVVFTGIVAPEKIPEEYYNADLVLNCSVDDPLPMTITEAMMYRKRVIVSSNCGFYHTLNKISDDMTYTVNDVEQLSRKIIIAFYQNGNKYSDICYKIFTENFEFSTLKNRLNSIINNTYEH